jgi:hypothetical protein
MTSKKTGGTNLWLTKPAERRPLLKSMGRRPAPAGTAPAVMSHSSIPAKPRVKIKATVHACVSFQGSYCEELARGSGGGARSRRSRIAGQPLSRDLRQRQIQEGKSKLRSAGQGWRGHEVARHPGPVATVGPAYPQDEPWPGVPVTVG